MKYSEYLSLRNHIILRLPDRLIKNPDKWHRFKGVSIPPLEKPTVEIFYRKRPLVDIRVSNYQSHSMTLTKKPIYLEYDTIASWIMNHIGFIDLTDYFWHPTLRKPEAKRGYQEKVHPIVNTQVKKNILESDVESALCRQLQRKHISYSRQFQCDAGIADVVTSTAIFEVKRDLNRKTLYEAIGQLYAYRGAINSNLELVVCFTNVKPNKYDRLIAIAALAGVKLRQVIP